MSHIFLSLVGSKWVKHSTQLLCFAEEIDLQSNLPTTGLREAVRLSTTAKLDGTESLPIPAIRLETPRSG